MEARSVQEIPGTTCHKKGKKGISVRKDSGRILLLDPLPYNYLAWLQFFSLGGKHCVSLPDWESEGFLSKINLVIEEARGRFACKGLNGAFHWSHLCLQKSAHTIRSPWSHFTAPLDRDQFHCYHFQEGFLHIALEHIATSIASICPFFFCIGA